MSLSVSGLIALNVCMARSPPQLHLVPCTAEGRCLAMDVLDGGPSLALANPAQLEKSRLGVRDDVGLMPVRPCCQMIQCKPKARHLYVGTRLKGPQCHRKTGLAKRTMQILEDSSSPACIWLNGAISIYPDPGLTSTGS